MTAIFLSMSMLVIGLVIFWFWYRDESDKAKDKNTKFRIVKRADCDGISYSPEMNEYGDKLWNGIGNDTGDYKLRQVLSFAGIRKHTLDEAIEIIDQYKTQEIERKIRERVDIEYIEVK